MDTALDAAIRIFRERGYHSTSMEHVQQATSLTSGSIYKAFKSKRAVFLAAFDRYVALSEARLTKTLQHADTGLDKLRSFLTAYAKLSCDDEGRRGCLIVSSAIELATLDNEVALRVTKRLDDIESALKKIILTGQSDGTISSDINCPAAARMILCTLQGMRVVGKTGRTYGEMAAVVDLAMRTIR